MPVFQKRTTHALVSHKSYKYKDSRALAPDPIARKLMVAGGVDLFFGFFGGGYFDSVNAMILKLYFMPRTTPDEIKAVDRIYQSVIDKRDEFLETAAQYNLADIQDVEDMKKWAKAMSYTYPNGEAASFYVWATLPDKPTDPTPVVPGGGGAAVVPPPIENATWETALIQTGIKTLVVGGPNTMVRGRKDPRKISKFDNIMIQTPAEAQAFANLQIYNRQDFVRVAGSDAAKGIDAVKSRAGLSYEWGTAANPIYYSPYETPQYGSYSYTPYTPSSNTMVPRRSYYS